MNNPNLIEPGVKYFFRETLKNCNVVKKEYNSSLINIGLFFLFIIFFGGFLYYKGKNKDLMKKEAEEKSELAKKEILKTLNKVNEDRYKEQGHIFTNMPKFEENTFEGTMNNLKQEINNNTTSINKLPNMIIPTQLEAIDFNERFSNMNY